MSYCWISLYKTRSSSFRYLCLNVACRRDDCGFVSFLLFSVRANDIEELLPQSYDRTTDENIVRHEHESLNVYQSDRCGHFVCERHCDFMLSAETTWLCVRVTCFIFSSIKINIKNAVNLLVASPGRGPLVKKQTAARGGEHLFCWMCNCERLSRRYFVLHSRKVTSQLGGGLIWHPAAHEPLQSCISSPKINHTKRKEKPFN